MNHKNELKVDSRINLIRRDESAFFEELHVLFLCG